MKSRLLFSVILLCFLAIIVKLFYLTVINAHVSTSEYVQSTKIYPERGKILDRNGEPLALNDTVYQLYAEPPKVKDKETMLTKIDDILHIGIATLEARYNPNKQWVSLAPEINKDAKNKISALNLPGVGFEDHSSRFYPEASLSAHLLGFLGKNADGENVGYSGIEGFYDKDLAGLPGFVKSERDLMGKPIFIGTQELLPAENGQDLTLSVDKAIQNIAKTKLKAAVDKYQAQQGCVVIADPNTMEILALSCLPDFDPTDYYDFPSDSYRNPAISNLYEPGSTFKPLIMAAGIQEKAIKPDETFDEAGPVTIGGYQIQTWDNKYGGEGVSMTEVLEKSSNVGMVYVGSKLGNKKVYDYVQKFGFGKPTGIDLQGEAAGLLKPKDQWYPIDYATATFGQGIAVTPIQMVRAFSAVINGGYLLKPYVVASIDGGNGEKKRSRQVITRIISDNTSAIIRKMLVDTVDHGEVKYNIPTGYKVGGKTGTAQIPIAGHYDPTKTIASFIGFAPADNPRFVMLTILWQPKVSEWGSETAAPLFFDIARDLFVYMNISPN